MGMTRDQICGATWDADSKQQQDLPDHVRRLSALGSSQAFPRGIEVRGSSCEARFWIVKISICCLKSCHWPEAFVRGNSQAFSTNTAVYYCNVPAVSQSLKMSSSFESIRLEKLPDHDQKIRRTCLKDRFKQMRLNRQVRRVRFEEIYISCCISSTMVFTNGLPNDHLSMLPISIYQVQDIMHCRHYSLSTGKYVWRFMMLQHHRPIKFPRSRLPNLVRTKDPLEHSY